MTEPTTIQSELDKIHGAILSILERRKYEELDILQTFLSESAVFVESSKRLETIKGTAQAPILSEGPFQSLSDFHVIEEVIPLPKMEENHISSYSNIDSKCPHKKVEAPSSGENSNEPKISRERSEEEAIPEPKNSPPIQIQIHPISEHQRSKAILLPEQIRDGTRMSYLFGLLHEIKVSPYGACKRCEKADCANCNFIKNKKKAGAYATLSLKTFDDSEIQVTCFTTHLAELFAVPEGELLSMIKSNIDQFSSRVLHQSFFSPVLVTAKITQADIKNSIVPASLCFIPWDDILMYAQSKVEDI